MKKITLLLVTTIAVFVLAACSGTEEPSSSSGEVSSQSRSTDEVRLSTGYADALSIQGQLALGTMKLEETDLAVNEELAANLLPLWRALQSLSNSETTAEAEIDAVLNQIQDTMTAEQIAAIAGMQMTEEDLTSMLESGGPAFGADSFGAAGDEDTSSEGGSFAGGPPPGDFAAGGPEGGGFPGGGPGGGPPGDVANLSEDDIATRQAAFEGGDFQERAFTGMVIRLLAQKSGEELGFPEDGND